MSWPSTLGRGTRLQAPISALDLVPTALAAAGAVALPERPAPSHEDARNRRRSNTAYGRFDGVNMLPVLSGRADPAPRTLHWRLQGQAAIMRGDTKLIRLGHRPAQLFDVGADPGERKDLVRERPDELADLFAELGAWESRLPTVPIWDSSPHWWGDSARLYDAREPAPEPR